MTDEELFSEQIEAVRADIAALRADGANSRDLSFALGSFSQLVKARRECREAEAAAQHRLWVRERERELLAQGWAPTNGSAS
jgi:hypothetical protein